MFCKNKASLAENCALSFGYCEHLYINVCKLNKKNNITFKLPPRHERRLLMDIELGLLRSKRTRNKICLVTTWLYIFIYQQIRQEKQYHIQVLRMNNRKNKIRQYTIILGSKLDKWNPLTFWASCLLWYNDTK